MHTKDEVDTTSVVCPECSSIQLRFVPYSPTAFVANCLLCGHMWWIGKEGLPIDPPMETVG